MTYTLNLDKPALTRFQKLPAPIQRLLVEKAHVLKTNCDAGAPLQGKHRLLRSLHLTIEDTAYRVIYQVFKRSEAVVVRLAAKREHIYRRLDAMKRNPAR